MSQQNQQTPPPERGPMGRGGRPPGPMGGPPPAGEKPKNFKESMGKLIAYCKSSRPIILLSLVFSVISGFCTLSGPAGLGVITTHIQEGLTSTINLDAITSIGTLLAGVYLLGFVLSYTTSFFMSTTAQKISFQLRAEMSAKINRLPLSYFDKRAFGDTLSRVTNDVDTIGNTLNQGLATLLNAFVMFFGAVILMFLTNWILALVALASSALGFVLMMIIMKSSQKFFAAQQKWLGEVNGHIEELYTGHVVVKAYHGEEKAHAIFSDLNEKLYHSAWKAQFLSGMMMPIMQFVGNLSYVAVCVVGCLLVLKDLATFSVVVSFIIYVRLFSQPLGQIAQVANIMQTTAAAAERVFQFLEAEEMEDESHKTTSLPPEKVVGNVDFQQVNFGYVPEKQIIKDFSVSVKAGQKVAIVGPTGCGKTTLVNLLMRFYEVDTGTITLDGIKMQELTRKNLQKNFSMVLQDTWLFDGTVRENILYRNQNVSQEQLEDACRQVGLHHFIKTLPQGYDTHLSEKASISVGQRQLITIARAMLENAPILILDEATSSIDTRTEVLIAQAMDKLSQGKTSFIIAHRLSTIKNADVILVMKEGVIIQQGTHDALLAETGFYSDLYNSQFSQEEE